ncbi:hypothetical protein Naga_100581g4, partial [Nannochloropsis gaditana]
MVDPNQKVSYGFQFLSQVEERGPGRGGVGDGVAGGERASGPQQQVLAPSIPRRTAADILAARADPRRNRPDTDKLFDVVTLLQQIPGHRPVSADEILKELGVDLRPPDVVDRAVHNLL